MTINLQHFDLALWAALVAHRFALRPTHHYNGTEAVVVHELIRSGDLYDISDTDLNDRIVAEFCEAMGYAPQAAFAGGW